MKSPKPATDTIYPHIKCWWYRTKLNFYPPFLCRVLAAILKMADILKILKMQNGSSNGDLSLCQIYFIEYSLTNFSLTNFMQYVREYIHILYWYSVCCALHLRGFFFTFFKGIFRIFITFYGFYNHWCYNYLHLPSTRS